MNYKGKAHKFGNDVNTDEIIPARYLNTTDPQELAKHCMEGIDPKFIKRMKSGDIIVAGKNFGCGSSREHAPLAIKAAGIIAVVARSYARIFFRNAINIGLPLFVCEEVDRVDDGDFIEINFEIGEIRDKTKDIFLRAKPLPNFIKKILEKGGLVNFLRSEGYK